MSELLHPLDRQRFQLRRERNLALGDQAELEMMRQRKEQGLPLHPKGDPNTRRNLIHLEPESRPLASRLSPEKPAE